MSIRFMYSFWIYFIWLGLFNLSFLAAQNSVNPFERPGSRQAKAPPVIRPAPPPPAPKPLNPNIELRGMFKFKDEWHFSIFDRGSNKGAWLKIGESFNDGKVKIEGFDPESEKLSIQGGYTLTLKNPSNQVLPVPSGQAVKKPSSPKKINTPQNRPRAITIPPRVNIPPRK